MILSTESQTLTGEKRQCTRLSSPPPQNKRSLFPTTCYFCKNDRVKHKQQIKFPITITTEQASMSIKQNAESMEDKTIYFEIKDVDLIAKELTYHRHCYKEFTRKKSEKLLNVNKTQKGDYQKVKDIIEKLVLNQNQAVSMANIHNAYALHPNDTRYRSKLKERIENDYKKQLLFVKVKNNSPDVVISSKALDSHLILNENEVLLKEAAVILRNDILNYLNNMSEVAWPPDIEKFS